MLETVVNLKLPFHIHLLLQLLVPLFYLLIGLVLYQGKVLRVLVYFIPKLEPVWFHTTLSPFLINDTFQFSSWHLYLIKLLLEAFLTDVIVKYVSTTVSFLEMFATHVLHNWIGWVVYLLIVIYWLHTPITFEFLQLLIWQQIDLFHTE